MFYEEKCILFGFRLLHWFPHRHRRGPHTDSIKAQKCPWCKIRTAALQLQVGLTWLLVATMVNVTRTWKLIVGKLTVIMEAWNSSSCKMPIRCNTSTKLLDKWYCWNSSSSVSVTIEHVKWKTELPNKLGGPQWTVKRRHWREAGETIAIH